MRRLFSITAVLILATSAPAQFRPAPNPISNQPPPPTQVISRTVNHVTPTSFMPNPWWGYGNWGQTAWNGFLTGAADVISAQGNFEIAKRESQVIRQQAEQAKLDTRRKAYEQWQWER